jgi:hypothetical protein
MRHGKKRARWSCEDAGRLAALADASAFLGNAREVSYASCLGTQVPPLRLGRDVFAAAASCGGRSGCGSRMHSIGGDGPRLSCIQGPRGAHSARRVERIEDGTSLSAPHAEQGVAAMMSR